jgi:GDPmannose 4,6-dehydratase
VRYFAEAAFARAGIALKFRGEGTDEKAYDLNTGACLLEVDPRYFRPAEVEFLLGDATKARKKLGWEPKVSLEELIERMVDADLEEAQRERYLSDGGFQVADCPE